MKTLLLSGLLLMSISLHAQIRRDTSLVPQPPVNNPYQFPNYYQNNSMYINNSMQNNRPPDQHAGPYTGNADYTDPTKNTPPATNLNNNPAQLNGTRVNK